MNYRERLVTNIRRTSHTRSRFSETMADVPSNPPGANPSTATSSNDLHNNSNNLPQEDQEALLLPLEREILDEYARLAGSLDDVRHPSPSSTFPLSNPSPTQS